MDSAEQKKEHLEESCRLLEGRLKELREELAATKVPQPVTNLRLLRSEEAVLRAQLAAMQANAPTAGTTDKDILNQRTIEEVERCNEGLEQALAGLEDEKTRLRLVTERYKEERERLSSLQQCLRYTEPAGVPGLAHLDELAACRERSKDLEEHLLDFLDTFYPPPTADDLAGRQKKAKLAAKGRGGQTTLDSFASTSRNDEGPSPDMQSLQELLEELTSRALRHPEDPFVMTTTRTWPPYVELLRRSGILCEHPDDSSRIKLAFTRWYCIATPSFTKHTLSFTYWKVNNKDLTSRSWHHGYKSQPCQALSILIFFFQKSHKPDFCDTLLSTKPPTLVGSNSCDSWLTCNRIKYHNLPHHFWFCSQVEIVHLYHGFVSESRLCSDTFKQCMMRKSLCVWI